MAISRDEIKRAIIMHGLTMFERKHGDNTLFRIEGTESGWYSLKSVAQQAGLTTEKRQIVPVVSAVAGRLHNVSVSRRRDIRDALSRIYADDACVVSYEREAFMEYVIIEARAAYTNYRAVIYLDDTSPIQWSEPGHEWDSFEQRTTSNGIVYHVRK